MQLSSDNYYVFDKEDLLRDNWNRKPAYGSVDPAVISEHTENYACHVDQMIMGIDNIRQTDLNRRQGPRTKDPRQQRTKVIATQANIHQDAEFSKSFMRKGVWKNEATGTDSVSVTSGQFIKFSNGNSDPIAFFQNKMTEINEETGRTPNRLGLGVNVYNALKEHPAILERVKYGGSTPNPAKVNLNVLAQLFEIDRIVLDRTVQNKAGLGQNADMTYLGNDTDYKRWAKQAGAGDAIVIPVWNGPGTVKLVLVDGNGKPANAKLVQDVYNYIVSPNDRSARLLPTGTAELTCAAATTVAVNYVITGLSYDETTGIEQIKADFTEAVRAVYAQAKTEGVLRYNDVRPLISAIAGVEDFETFTMNGKMQNITLKSEEYPDTGTLNFS